jgi:hypothetical protein
VKRSRRAQTVLGDRHDLIYEILLQVQSAACGTRPAEFFNGWARKQIRDRSEKRSSENLIRQRYCKFSRPPAELARQNFSTAGHANRFVTDLKNVRARI